MKSEMQVTKYPRKAPKIKQRNEVYGVCVVQAMHQSNIHYLVVKRPPFGLLAGQWEFPSFKVCYCRTDVGTHSIVEYCS